MKFALWLIFISFPLLGKSPRSITASYDIDIKDCKHCTESILLTMSSHGGWFTSLTKKELRLRIPVEKLKSFIHKLGQLGPLLEQGSYSDELKSSWLSAKAKLKAAQSVLPRYLQILGKAQNQTNLIKAESEAFRIISEIEYLKSTLINLEDRMAHAKITIALRNDPPPTPKPIQNTRFTWIRELGIHQLLGGNL